MLSVALLYDPGVTTTAEPEVAEEPIALEGDWHAETCDGACSRWIFANAPGCLPYPCVCERYKTERGWGSDRCWYPRKVNGIAVGGITSRCPCWGGKRESKPGNCCSHHSANPLYIWDSAAGCRSIPGKVTLQDDEDPAGADSGATPEEVAHRPDLDELDWRYIDDPWIDPDRQLPPFIRTWQPEELVCGCPTPWDVPPGKKVDIRTVGWHCCDCHTNWTSYAAGAVHRRRWTEPCRHPSTILDVDTGKPLLELHGEVWSASTRSSYRPAGWTPGRFTTTVRLAAAEPAEAFSWD